MMGSSAGEASERDVLPREDGPERFRGRPPTVVWRVSPVELRINMRGCCVERDCQSDREPNQASGGRGGSRQSARAGGLRGTHVAGTGGGATISNPSEATSGTHAAAISGRCSWAWRWQFDSS